MAIATPESKTESKPPVRPAQESSVDLDWLTSKIDYRLYQDCVHCGLCTASCPTYLETSDENDSPRGRIYLMRAVADGRLDFSPEVREHLDLCLDCRACESACPSGVQYGKIIEPFKVALQRTAPASERTSLLRRLILHHLFPYSGRVKLALMPARLLQRVGLINWAEKVGLTKLLPPTLRRMQAMLPDLTGSHGHLPEVLPAIGPKRARVALFLGCVADAMYPETNAATARVLQQNGCEVVVPRSQVCCGAIHYHSGVEEPALELARQNIAAFDPTQYDAIIVNAAGCGAMLKDYPHLLPAADHTAAEQFTAKVRDISEFLVALGPIKPTHSLPMKVTYHDACHLCHGQQIRSQPRQLLAMIPGVELVPLEETEICCGAAGTYNLTQPEMSERLGIRKMDHLAATGAEVVATGNVGCILQIARKIKERGSPMKVVHPVDLLDRAYGGEPKK
ncbi:glycolate oxidase iron-sulfur subunit [Singulisphaera sp. GP187]|uniref:(Fe-S)-binding protein n=1 Tax=Singulisphaera sp. GP187 TaxID=1882752 RepID=UPI000925D5A3|nr:(Fe-S)-binding protein [Singulisphaera sp. GP187]SIO65395.1 glycolate oxidase iron-sulfur subunit [Singulisphaera sp. GP187]